MKYSKKHKYSLALLLMIVFAFSIFPFLSLTNAAGERGYHITTSVPGTNIKQGDAVKDNYTLTTYVKNIYVFALTIVGLVALAAMVYWSFIYIAAAGGNPSKMADAISGMKDAILGLALLLLASLILGFINPKLAVLNPLDNIEDLPAKNSTPATVVGQWKLYLWQGGGYEDESGNIITQCVQIPPAATWGASTCTDADPSSALQKYLCCEEISGAKS